MTQESVEALPDSVERDGDHPGFRVGVVGLGHHGAAIASLVAGSRHHLVGAVDVGAKVGARISDLVTGPVDVGATVLGSLDELADLDIDIAVLTAAVPLDVVLDQAGRLVDRGVNVLTLHQDLFEPRAPWAEELDRRASAGGATVLATGVQDTWWVHLPNVAAGSSWNVRSVTVTSCVDVNTLSEQVAREQVGVDLSVEEFTRFRTALEDLPPVQGAPLRVAARRMGLEPRDEQRTVTPVLAHEPTRWTAAARTIPAGRTVGLEERVEFATDGGLRFVGLLRTVVLPQDEAPVDRLEVDGDPPLHLEYRPFPGEHITNVAVINRIVDVVEGPAGLLTAADLPPASYRP